MAQNDNLDMLREYLDDCDSHGMIPDLERVNMFREAFDLLTWEIARRKGKIIDPKIDLADPSLDHALSEWIWTSPDTGTFEERAIEPPAKPNTDKELLYILKGNQEYLKEYLAKCATHGDPVDQEKSSQS